MEIQVIPSVILIDTLDQWAGVTSDKGCSKMPNQFFNFRGSCYDNDKILYQKMTSEALDMHGVKCDYYVLDYSTNNEKVFGEDNDKHITRQFKIKVHFETPPETRKYSQWGIEDVDTFEMFITKVAFNKYSNNYQPKYGDLIRPHYDGNIYEITDVIDTTEQFLNTQHNWKFTVKVWENTQPTTTSGVQDENTETYDGQTYQPIEEFTENGSDTLKQNEIIEEEKDDVLYQDIDNNNNNPFGGW